METPIFPELQQLEMLIQQHAQHVHTEVLTTVPSAQHTFPLYALSLGTQAASAPCICFVGGVHGLERIGTQVVLAFLETLLERLHWDLTLDAILQQIRLVFIPIVNPVGMLNHTRANGHGVDLMRNAPVDSTEATVWLAGGHRISPHLPWYRGAATEPMQLEAETLCQFMRQHILTAPFSLVLDCHSGFGLHDRIWFPYAKSREEAIPHLGDMYTLRQLFFQTYPYQNYYFEPQSLHYLTHGDLWDYLYMQSLTTQRTFLPLTLEMGSWRWIRKNPLQAFYVSGMFHPMKPHRINRVLRGHLVLMEFLVRATLSYQQWSAAEQYADSLTLAKAMWYER